MEILEVASVGFLVVFLGTLFIFGELMVRAKGLFAILGIAIMGMYFSYHLGEVTSLWVVILYLIGIALIIFDGNVTMDGTIGLIGSLLMIFSLALPAPSVVYGVLVAMGVVIGAAVSYLFTKVFPPRNLWSKLMFKEKMSAELGYQSMNESHQELVGKTGVATTDFRPIGTVEIDGRTYSATSEGRWLNAGTDVKVIDVDGTRMVVVPLSTS
ncbi:NfeD family protein [Texcoconibacillus texcoconensis]|nr:NfeD family protein [Texcoconibacillus texcoconensis]